MKIGIFTNNYLPNPYGVTGSVESFRIGLEALGHEVFIFAPHWKDYQDANPHIFRYPSIDLPLKFRFPLAIPYSWKMRRIIKKLDLDIIHSQHPNLLGSAARKWARKKKIPLVFTWHTLYDQYANFVPFLPPKLVSYWTIKNAVSYANRSDMIITPTSSIVPILREWGVTQEIVSQPTGVLEKEFEGGDRKKTREKYGIGEDEVCLLLVSRMTEEKNIEFVFRSLKEVLHKNEKVKMLVVGGGYLIPNLRDFCQEKGIADKVTFTGEVKREEVKNCYVAGDILVYASKSETQGMVISEAMYMGLPVVAVRATGVQSLVMDKVNGILVNDEEGEFQKAVEKIILDSALRERFSQESSRISKENYTSEICAKKMLAIYEQVIQKGESA